MNFNEFSLAVNQLIKSLLNSMRGVTSINDFSFIKLLFDDEKELKIIVQTHGKLIICRTPYPA